MPSRLETHGDIEIICLTDDLAPNKMAQIVFRAFGDAMPPFEIMVKAPSGNVIVKRVIRELPTGEPQSPEPIAFAVQKGDYEIMVNQLRGGAEGQATLTVGD